MLRSAGAGALLMAVMLPGLALMRDTAGHDWYAAGKVTLADAAVASRLDRDAPMQYRTREGETETLTRHSMRFVGEALRARSLLVSTFLSHAVLGIPAGAVLALFFEIVWTNRRAGEAHVEAIRPTPEREPPRKVWTGVECVDGVLRLRGMEPVRVWVVPSVQDGASAQVYAADDGRDALPDARGRSAINAPPVNRPRALPAPEPESGNAQPGSGKNNGPASNLPARSQPKPAARRGRKQRKPARPKPGKGKLWF